MKNLDPDIKIQEGNRNFLYNEGDNINTSITFSGRQKLLHLLQQDLSRCQGIALNGLRKSGKTSVLRQLKLYLPKSPIVYIDIKPYGGTNYGAKLFNEILKQLYNLLNQQNSDSNFLVEFFEINTPAKEITSQFVEQFCWLAKKLLESNYNLPIICLLDEIQGIFPTEKEPAEKVEEFNAVFGTLRQLSQAKRNLSLLVADVYPDFNRLNVWTQPYVPSNPVFQFFKEIHLQPFTLEETQTMLTEIGQLMGVEFEPEILKIIHTESGGHPFIAQQIAGLLYQRAEKQKRSVLNLITYSSAEPYLKSILDYSDTLNNYFQKDIWDDLDKRNFTIAMTILRLLAGHDSLTEQRLEEAVLAKLNGKCCLNDYESALLWLENIGLLKEHQLEDEISYSLSIKLMSRWLRKEKKI